MKMVKIYYIKAKLNLLNKEVVNEKVYKFTT